MLSRPDKESLVAVSCMREMKMPIVPKTSQVD